MTGHAGSPESGAASADDSLRVVLTVRLHGRTNELLIEEFEHLGRRRRAARAAQLMLIGLLYERTLLRPGAGAKGVAPPTLRRAASAADFGLAAEADAFVSAILRAPGSSQMEEDRRRSLPGDTTAEDSPPGHHMQETRRVEIKESVPAPPGRP